MDASGTTPALLVWGCLVIVAGFVLDMAVGPSMVVRGVRPDLTIAVLAPLALAVGAPRAAGFGLLAGLLEASFASLAFGSLAVSRTLMAWLVGLLDERLFRENLLVTGLAGFLGSLTADVAFYLFAPQSPPGAYAIQALGRAIYTMVLVLPFSLVIRVALPQKA